MFDKEPNIDIVFRNGLKNLEVLPPADVWENIAMMPGARRRYGMVFRIAAGLAALVTLTLLVSWFTRTNGVVSTEPLLASVLNDNDTPSGPEVREATTNAIALPQRVSEALTAPMPTRDEEQAIANSATLSLPALAFRQDSPDVVADEGTKPVITEDGVIIIPQKVLGLSSPDLDLAVMEQFKYPGERFFLGASISPSMGFSGTPGDIRMAELLSNEKGVPTYSTGLTFAYKLSPRLSIQSGIGVASLGQVVAGIDVFAGLSEFYSAKGNYLYSVETSSGRVVSGNADLYLADSKNRVGTFIPRDMADPSKYPLTLINDEIHQVFRYLEVPLLFRYKVIDRDIDMNLSGGMSYGFLVQNSAFAMDGNNMVSIGHTEGVNMHTISSQVGLGMEYSFSKVISFNVEPVFRYYLTPFSDLAGTLSRPYSFGLFSGFFLRF
ncbi:MAG TPA: outer membrane beta-barrel protein [Bacteroidales bacterium]|nr:outer membrane beta-barrel protein [Bacteroidales bacterium]